MRAVDVIVIGAGHNGLVASLLLARAGYRVEVLESRPSVGGACVTEYPFQVAPKLGSSTGAYLLGLMPPELMATLGLELPLIRRDPHYFLPTLDRRYLLFGSNAAELQRQFVEFFSSADWDAHCAMNAELSALRDDLAPAWLMPPLSLEETAEQFIRPELRSHFIGLCRGSAQDYLERFEFRSELVKAMYAVTDAFSGLNGGYHTPGTGMNFLVHNMCRLPGSDGTWMVVKGGMGTVTQKLARLALEAGAHLRTDARVSSLLVSDQAVTGVALASGEEISSRVVISNADPFRTLEWVDPLRLPGDYQARLGRLKTDGSTLKVNLCLQKLPRFRCLPEERQALGATIHLLPEENGALTAVERAFRQMKEGQLPEFPAIEWYIHTAVDPSLQDAERRHSSALFVQWVPYQLRGTSWENEEARYVKHLLSICDLFAPGTSDLVQEVFTLSPPGIERHFGISRGHIHHVDNRFGFDQRIPYQGPLQGLYYCGAGCHPAGSVIGAAGHNAAQWVKRELRS